jgi:hypothetical protein
MGEFDDEYDSTGEGYDYDVPVREFIRVSLFLLVLFVTLSSPLPAWFWSFLRYAFPTF